MLFRSVYTIRVYAVGSWIIDLFLICLCFLDVYNYVTFSWLSVVGYSLRIFGIVIYTVVALQCLTMWDTFIPHRNTYYTDVAFATILIIIYAGVTIGFIIVIVESEENAWRLIYF